MNRLNEIINELGISKVRLAKYLGVSRQMLYNYLAMDSIEKWPKEKSTRLFTLLGINDESEIDKIDVNSNFIIDVENKLENENREDLSKEVISEFRSFNKKEQELLSNIINLLKENLSDDKNKDMYYTFNYLYNFLKEINNINDLKYLLVFMSKYLGYTPVNEFLFNKDVQYTFEGIMWSGYSLYKSNNDLSKLKIAMARDRFVKEIESRNEEKLGRTQELNSTRDEALKELGYTELTEENAKEVLDKITEIEARKVTK